VIPFAVVFCVLIWGVAPSVTIGDSGELIGAAMSVGVAHPPGYPWFMVFTKMAMSLLPFGSLAFRAAVGSAALAALAVSLLMVLTRDMMRSLGPWRDAEGAVSGRLVVLAVWLVWLGSPLVMQAVTQAEVYSFHLVLVSAMGILVCRWEQSSVRTLPLLVVGVLGISLAHHHLALLLVPFVAVWWTWRMGKGWTAWWMGGTVAGMGMAGAGLLIALCAVAAPSISWGAPGTWQEVVAHLTRQQYGALASHHGSLQHIWAQASAYLDMLTAQWSWMWWGVVGIGFAVIPRAAVWWGGGLWVAHTVGLMILLRYSMTPESLSIVETFWLPSLALVGLVAAAGVTVFWRWLKSKLPATALLAIALGVLGVVGVVGGRRSWSDRWDLLGYELGMNLLMTAEESGSLLLSGDNQLFSVVYLQEGEHWAPLVSIYEGAGKLRPALPEGALFEMAGRGPLHVGVWSRWATLLDASGRRLIPDGICYRTSGRSPFRGETDWRWRRLRLRDAFSSRGRGVASRMVEVQYWYFLGERAALEEGPSRRERTRRWLERARAVGWDLERLHYNVGRFYEKMNWIDDARLAYISATRVNPEYSLPYNNLGVQAFKGGAVDEAVRLFREALAADPANVEAMNNLGSAYAERNQPGDRERAITVWRLALRKIPSHPLVIENLQKIGAQRKEEPGITTPAASRPPQETRRPHPPQPWRELPH